PTSDLVNICIKHSTLEQVIVTITDLQGKEVYNGLYAGISNTIGINTTAFSPGTYVLSLKNNKKQSLGTYRVIKH
ncbi:MAG: T9SS type A sorting domain-containing protein, partial [Bacteroidota bacterium]